MSALDELQTRVAADPGWVEAFRRNEAEAKQAASGMPLAHVSSAGLRDLLEKAPRQLECSAPGRSSPRTLEAQARLGYPPSLYFYAGRCFPPRMGSGVAFAFGPECEAGHTGSSTPFDSAGMVLERIRRGASAVDPVTYVKSAEVQLERWRTECGTFLAAYFDPLSSYWTERPSRCDPDKIFQNPANDYRAWTWEVRFEEPQSVLRAAFWGARSEQMLQLQRLVGEASPADQDMLRDFSERALDKRGSKDYCGLVEAEARKVSGL